ncbi:MAG: hypothetical protein MJ219_03740 [Mycoplasmoidaceae bacterium]|nr:hypothetical protein [Mycoplasmoidaceae bacterium]
MFTIKTKHDQLHIEKGEIGTGVQVSGDITGTYGDAIVFDYTVTDANYEVTKIQAKTESGSFSSPSVQHESGNVYTVTFD